VQIVSPFSLSYHSLTHFTSHGHAAIYDVVWDELDKAADEKKLIACRRISADPFSDKNSDRLGIKLGISPPPPSALLMESPHRCCVPST
jgi:hypothetical protein